MTDQSTQLTTEKAPAPHFDKAAPVVFSTPQKPKSHWFLYLVVWILTASLSILGWNFVQLERRTTQLELSILELSHTVTTLSSLKQTHTAPLPATHTDENTRETTHVVMPSNTTTVPNSIEHSASNHVSNFIPLTTSSLASPYIVANNSNAPTAFSLPEWISRAPLSIAQALLNQGEWEAAAKIIEIIKTTSPKSSPEIEPIWRTFQSQRNTLETVAQQLKNLETDVYQLPVRKMQSNYLLQNLSTVTEQSGTFWEKVEREIREDVSMLVRIEPSDAGAIRARNSAAFEWRRQLTNALRDYHLAWKKGNTTEQERIKEYINHLLPYAFDTNDPFTKSFYQNLNSFLKQPTLTRPYFPAAAGGA